MLSYSITPLIVKILMDFQNNIALKVVGIYYPQDEQEVADRPDTPIHPLVGL